MFHCESFINRASIFKLIVKQTLTNIALLSEVALTYDSSLKFAYIMYIGKYFLFIHNKWNSNPISGHLIIFVRFRSDKILDIKMIIYDYKKNSIFFLHTYYFPKELSSYASLRGSTSFQGVIFYLWTDFDEICTVYVKLNSYSIFFMQIFWISV